MSGDGDRAAVLWDQHADAVYAYARRRVGASAAPDVVADVFSVVVAHPDRVPDDALPWLYRTAWNVIANLRRSEARRVPFLLEGVASDDPAGAVVERSAAIAALSQLSDADREVLLLVAWEGPRRAAGRGRRRVFDRDVLGAVASCASTAGTRAGAERGGRLMPDVVEHLRQLDPVHPTRWSGTAEGRATRARVFDGLAGRSRPRSRTTPMLVAAGLVLAIVALVFVATRGSRDTAPLARSRANFSTGTWTVARGGPGHFSPTSAFWTGDEYFVTGKIGCCWAGETYRPSTKTWRRVPDPPRQPGDEAVFTGKAIIWQESGVAYDPARRTWDVLANPLPLPFADPLVVWMGHELAVIGGNTAAACRGECPGAIGAAAYSPDQDRWRRIAEPPGALSSAASAIWDGKEVLLVDPLNGLPPQNFVGVYDPLRDVWQSLPPPGPQALGGSPVAAQRRVATFALEGTDTRLVAQVFDVRRRKWSSAASDMAGSTCEPQSVAVRGGAVVECREIELFDLASLRWRAMPQPPMPVVNLVWTGKELLGTSANGEHLLVYRPGR